MIVKSAAEFIAAINSLELTADAPATPRGAFLVDPAAFHLSEETARDNFYMDLSVQVSQKRALAQSRGLAQAITAQNIPVVRFAGDPETPDAVFPNNVFATIPGRLIVGAMLHPERQREAERNDIRNFFTGLLQYQLVDLSQQHCVAELTGPLILDRARRIGFCGMTRRVDQAGVAAMHQAFGLQLTFQFDLIPEEYHTNVVMMILASRACVIYADAFADPEVPEAIAQAFPGYTLFLNKAEKEAFAGNCIALSDKDLFMSQTGVDALRPESRDTLENWGFDLHGVAVDELEKAGGSLRCMVAEIF